MIFLELIELGAFCAAFVLLTYLGVRLGTNALLGQIRRIGGQMTIALQYTAAIDDNVAGVANESEGLKILLDRETRQRPKK